MKWKPASPSDRATFSKASGTPVSKLDDLLNASVEMPDRSERCFFRLNGKRFELRHDGTDYSLGEESERPGGHKALLDLLSSAFSTRVDMAKVKCIRYTVKSGKVVLKDVEVDGQWLGNMVTSVRADAAAKEGVTLEGLVEFLNANGARPAKRETKVSGVPQYD